MEKCWCGNVCNWEIMISLTSHGVQPEMRKGYDAIGREQHHRLGGYRKRTHYAQLPVDLLIPLMANASKWVSLLSLHKYYNTPISSIQFIYTMQCNSLVYHDQKKICIASSIDLINLKQSSNSKANVQSVQWTLIFISSHNLGRCRKFSCCWERFIFLIEGFFSSQIWQRKMEEIPGT